MAAWDGTCMRKKLTEMARMHSTAKGSHSLAPSGE